MEAGESDMRAIATILGSKSVMPFGVYEGELVENIIQIDKPYVSRLIRKGFISLTPVAHELMYSHETDELREEINESY